MLSLSGNAIMDDYKILHRVSKKCTYGPIHVRGSSTNELYSASARKNPSGLDLWRAKRNEGNERILRLAYIKL